MLFPVRIETTTLYENRKLFANLWSRYALRKKNALGYSTTDLNKKEPP